MVNLCVCRLCGIDFEGHPLSMYCEKCQKQKKKEWRRGAYRNRADKYCKFSAVSRKGVKVIYKDGCGEDYYSKSSFNQYLLDKAFMPGDKYILDGVMRTVV